MSLSRLLLRIALGSRLPTTSGELTVRGVGAPITIRRDKWGVPHIDAASEADAYFALGFCQGQDRAAQLEVMWRLARGRLSEWVGPVAIIADRMSRRIGFRRTAEAQLAVVSEQARAAFTSFAAGVNAGTTVGLPDKPHEFAIVGGEPSRWDAADAVAVLKLQAFLLPSNWDVELARLRILLADGKQAVKELDPVGELVSREPKASAKPEIVSQLIQDLNALQAYLPRGGGSNNWVIAGSRTQSGKPILASDPHLAPTCPPPWYLAHVRTPQWDVAGAALAGALGFPIGHNGFCAWGVTAGLTDNSDFFIETLSPDGKSYRQPDSSFAPCELGKEVISVKGQADIVEEVLLTPRGPILTPVLPGISQALSFSAIWLEARPINGFLGVPAARSFEEFRSHFAQWPSLPLNVLYADTSGTIGWQLIGEVPTRRGGFGLLPRPADLPYSGWSGTVPFEAMPFAVNPECGYLATANDDPSWADNLTPPPPSLGGKGAQRQPNPLAPFPEKEGGAEQNQSSVNEGEPNVPPATLSSEGGAAALAPPSLPGKGAGGLGWDFIDDYRANRIRELLAQRDSGWTPADIPAMQLDVQSIPWREMRDAVLALTPSDPDARDAINLLGPWDGRVESESPAAAVFELFVSNMCIRVAKAKAPNSWHTAVGAGAMGILDFSLFTDRRMAHLSRLVREQPPGWFASWPNEMEAALAEVARKLRREVGPGPAYWAWGHTRLLTLENPLLGKHPLLRGAFNRGPIPWGGDSNTVSQAAVRHTDPRGPIHNIANMRAIFDLNDLSLSTFVLAGGQSGNPLSEHHADQLPLWQAGESFVMPWDQASVIRAAVNTLRLLPS